MKNYGYLIALLLLAIMISACGNKGNVDIKVDEDEAINISEKLENGEEVLSRTGTYGYIEREVSGVEQVDDEVYIDFNHVSGNRVIFVSQEAVDIDKGDYVRVYGEFRDMELFDKSNLLMLDEKGMIKK